jgi:chorismate mutase/GNAT superfamily N-acetyltransferase
VAPTEQSPPAVTLRPATEEDAGAVAEVHLAARRQAPMPPSVHPDHEVREWVASRLATDEVWVGQVGDDVAGYLRMTPTWLDAFYVHPAHAGRGVGTALLELAKARRPDGFCLWVFEMNAPARAFYARRGLIELERTDGSDNEEHEPDVRMAWPGRDPLAFFRRLIDDVDDQLGDLLARRLALTSVVQQYKAAELGDATRDAARERQIAERMARRAPALGTDRLQRVVHTIITESLDAATGRR